MSQALSIVRQGLPSAMLSVLRGNTSRQRLPAVRRAASAAAHAHEAATGRAIVHRQLGCASMRTAGDSALSPRLPGVAISCAELPYWRVRRTLVEFDQRGTPSLNAPMLCELLLHRSVEAARPLLEKAAAEEPPAVVEACDEEDLEEHQIMLNAALEQVPGARMVLPMDAQLYLRVGIPLSACQCCLPCLGPRPQGYLTVGPATLWL